MVPWCARSHLWWSYSSEVTASAAKGPEAGKVGNSSQAELWSPWGKEKVLVRPSIEELQCHNCMNSYELLHEQTQTSLRPLLPPQPRVLCAPRDGEPVEEVEDEDKYTFNYDGSELIIHRVDKSDEAEYICIAENKAGEADATIHLKVFGKQPLSTPWQPSSVWDTPVGAGSFSQLKPVGFNPELLLCLCTSAMGETHPSSSVLKHGQGWWDQTQRLLEIPSRLGPDPPELL